MSEANHQAGTRSDAGITAFILGVWILVALVGIALISAVGIYDLPAPALAVLPFALLAGIALIANTRWGICFVAFAIAPLGIIQAEVASVTINLPEALILALVAKEFLILLASNERPSDIVSWRALGLYLFASAVGMATGFYYGNGFAAVLQDFRQFTEFVVLYLLVIDRVKDRAHIRAILACFAAGIALIALHGILQRFTGLGIPATQLMSDLIFHQGIRSGSFYGSTPLGGLMVLGLGPTIGLILSTSSRRLKAFWSLIAVLLIVAAVFTNTRASWLAIAVLLAFVFLTIRKRPAIIAVAVAAAIAFTATLGPLVVQRMSTLSISKTERSLMERVQYYTVAWHIARAHPIFGMGWGGYYDLKEILANDRFVESERPHFPDNILPPDVTVHSAYLQLIVKIGVLGLITFLLFLLTWFIWVLRVMRAPPDSHAPPGSDASSQNEADRNLFIGTSGALFGYLFHSAGENFFQWPVMSQSFWLLLGLSTIMAVALSSRGALLARGESPDDGGPHGADPSGDNTAPETSRA